MRASVVEPVAGRGPEAPDLPPSDLPVVLWPAPFLRAALAGTRGAALARLVADAVDLEGHALDGADGAGSGMLADLPDDALADLVVACGRVQSWAAGVQSRVVAERAARESHPLAHSSLVAQVSGELAVTGAEASDVVVRGEAGADHPTVVAALVAGRIDVRKAHTLLRSASRLTTQERAQAIARYLPQAPHRTWRWLQRRLLAFAASLHGAEESARAAAEQRSVQLDRSENDMAWLTSYLPAVDAAAVWGVVDEMAHQLRRVPGEERTLSQLRADSLAGIVTGRLLPAGRLAAESRSLPVPERDPAPSADGEVCTCGGRAPAVRQVVRVTPTRPTVRITVPATTLLGVDDAPGELAGFGPVPAVTARAVATDATWQRLLTDPVTGVLTDCSTTTYQPGSVLRRAVQARDVTCTFPHCEHPAERSDLDHVVPFDHDLDPAGLPPGTPGQTRATNLHALCRRHHLLKTHGGWGVVRDPDTGVTTWIAPSGRADRRTPTVLDTHVDLAEVDPDTSYDLTLRALTGGGGAGRGGRHPRRGSAAPPGPEAGPPF